MFKLILLKLLSNMLTLDESILRRNEVFNNLFGNREHLIHLRIPSAWSKVDPLLMN